MHKPIRIFNGRTLSNSNNTPSRYQPFSMRSISVLLLGGICASFIAGCVESKISQCNRFVAVVNKETPFATTFTTEQAQLQPGVKQGDQTALNQSAQSLRSYSKQLYTLVEEAKGLELEDTVVDGLRQRYVSQQGQYSLEIKTLATAIEKLGDLTLDFVELKGTEGKVKGTQIVMKQFQDNINVIRDDYANYCTNGFHKEDLAQG